jgi:hypothetical protein
MTNSTKLSSGESAKAHAELEAFLRGEVPVSRLRKALAHRFAFYNDDAPASRGMRDISLDDIPPLSVSANHVISMLDRFRLGLVRAQELSDWAALLVMLPVFVPEGETDEQRWEASNGPVWDTLHRLAVPNVFGELTPGIAQDYMELLQED